MFGRKHKTETLKLMSDKRSISVSLYDNNNNYILTFRNNVSLSKFINCHKGTVGRYLKSGKLFKKTYYIRVN
jgi:group I intron endonuclease